MAVDLTANLLSYLGWGFLPRYVTSFLQNLYYRIIISAGSPRPQRGSSRYNRDHRRIFIFVVTSYLLYTLVDAYKKVCAESDFYQILGVLPTSDDRTIKSRFRRLAAVHHPDKVQQSAGGDNGESSDAFFLLLRLAQDSLLDPTKRFAYDRFGRSVVEDSKRKTIVDLLYSGLQVLLPQYVGGLVITVILNMFVFSSWGRYWRFYTLFALFTLEVALLTHPTGVFMPSLYLPSWLSNILGLDAFYLLPFQILSLARTTSMTFNIFISQLTPPEQSQQDASPSAGTSLTQKHQRLIMQLGEFARLNEAQSKKLLQLELAPFTADKETVPKLRTRMKHWVKNGYVKDHPEVQRAASQALERRKDEVH